MRVISQPRGNMLLVGIGGSGRQSLNKLATYICDYLMFQVEVTKQYRKQEFREGKVVLDILAYPPKFMMCQMSTLLCSTSSFTL